MLVFDNKDLSNYSLLICSKILLRKLNKHIKFDNDDYYILKIILENILKKG